MVSITSKKNGAIEICTEKTAKEIGCYLFLSNNQIEHSYLVVGDVCISDGLFSNGGKFLVTLSDGIKKVFILSGDEKILLAFRALREKWSLADLELFEISAHLEKTKNEISNLEQELQRIKFVRENLESRSKELNEKVNLLEKILLVIYDLNSAAGPGSRKKVREMIESTINLEQTREAMVAEEDS